MRWTETTPGASWWTAATRRRWRSPRRTGTANRYQPTSAATLRKSVYQAVWAVRFPTKSAPLESWWPNVRKTARYVAKCR